MPYLRQVFSKDCFYTILYIFLSTLILVCFVYHAYHVYSEWNVVLCASDLGQWTQVLKVLNVGSNPGLVSHNTCVLEQGTLS